ncbi:MAG TPA: transporter, partial [Gammaproteobacteria bacterium]|nr:transporter [Gammaproteobacteria bacterium]
MKRLIIQLAMLGGLILAAAGATAAAPADSATPTIQFHTCVIQGENGIQSEKARCGTLAVPENRAKPDGPQIKLSIAILPALTANPAPDPL